MNHPYLPHTETEIQSMLETIGVSAVEDLFSSIPVDIRERAGKLRDLFAPLSEQDLYSKLDQLAKRNVTDRDCMSFLAGGCNRHYVPAVINYLTQRGEFLTSYTPYQPEVAQGNLQALFEYQTMVTELTGLEVANAGLYDAGTALVEAVLMALRVNSERKVIAVAETLSPGIIGCLQTISHFLDGVKIVKLEVDRESGAVCSNNYMELMKNRGSEVAAVVVGYPNYLGVMEDLELISNCASQHGAIVISLTCEALALALFEAPGSGGVDIAVGDLQSFGVSPSYGGPWCGFLATRESMLRQMPGRLVGETTDQEGRRGFVLTLSTREQHIRRERATSNICTNNALLALSAAIYMSLYGPQGLTKLALINYHRRTYLEDCLRSKGIQIPFNGPKFNQFVMGCSSLSSSKLRNEKGPDDRASKLIEYLMNHRGVLVGPRVADHLVLVSVSELNNRESLDAFVDEICDLKFG